MLRICSSAIGLFLLGMPLRAVARSANDNAASSLPIVEVKLGPPQVAWPEVAAEVAKLERIRESRQSGLLESLRVVRDAEIVEAKALIDQLIAQEWHSQSAVPGSHGLAKLSFLQRGPNADFTLKLAVMPVARPDPRIQDKIDLMERTREEMEQDVFQQAKDEMKALTSIVLKQLRASLTDAHRDVAGPSFIQNANVRLRASDDAFPRVSDMIQDMQLRRDRAESEDRKQILMLELGLLQAENDMIRAAFLNLKRH
mmetsp:Transcript_56765/g.164383  ORF Transcript_56765/g.164383 Transcript_56765/m.164383 type:complete len:256 (-) Transcript_56765:39-806(-)